MMRLLRKLVVLLLAIILGFWLATANVLEGTTVGSWMDTLMNHLPDATLEWNQIDVNLPNNLTQNNTEEEQSTTELPAADTDEHSDEVDYDVIESEILHLLNDLRTEEELNTLDSNEVLRQAATIRAQETEELFSHTRPDGRDAFTVFDDGIDYNYQLMGENLGMATYHLEEEEMAELIFNGWVESEGHYENMVRPDYEEVGIGVHYDGEYIYATQLFGTQL